MIKDIFDYVISLLKSRLFPLIMVFVLIVVVLINRLFSLQIIKGASYVTDLTDSIQKNMIKINSPIFRFIPISYLL